MAYYYSSAYSGSNYGEYNLNSYAINYNYAQTPTSLPYNNHEFNQPYYYGYDPSFYVPPNYPAQSYQTIAYSATTFSDPKSIEYDPNYGMTQLVISYSTLEFNEPAYDEYDPTPYGGGYDIAETYGKPLPPSDEICYPRSESGSISPPLIVPLPHVEDRIDEKAIKPQNETAGQVNDEKPQSQDSTSDQSREVEDKSHDTNDMRAYEAEEESEESHHEDDYSSGSVDGSGFGNGYSSGGQNDEYEKQVPPQYPSGYGLEAVDLCESLFGYWPCLSRMKKREQQCCQEVSHTGNSCQENMWKGTADYLFGNPYPYGGGGEDGNSYGGGLVLGYERHYPTQAQSRQIDHTHECW